MKDSDDEDETKPNDIKEPSSVNSKSSSSDDIKPLSRRKAKSQKANKDKNIENVPVQESVETEEKTEEVKKEKFTVANIKVEPEEHTQTEKEIPVSQVPNIIQEAARIIFDQPAESEDITCDAGVVHPGIFARMTSQPMIVSSQPGEFKYVGYESESIAGPKTIDEVHEMHVTVKGMLAIEDIHFFKPSKLKTSSYSIETINNEKLFLLLLWVSTLEF